MLLIVSYIPGISDIPKSQDLINKTMDLCKVVFSVLQGARK